MKNTTTETRPALSFDGFGINGPDIYRARIATFTDANEGKKWGPLFAAAPELLEALERILALHDDAIFVNGSDDDAKVGVAINRIRDAIAKARA